nr:DUF3341 domain-containing protein [Vaginella massiliensis]
MTDTKIVYGLYGDDDDLMQAVKNIRNKNIEIEEVYTPFPVHGLDKALGLKKTRISDIAFFYGLFGTTLAVTMTWFFMNHDWPQDIGGKPSFSWGQNMPAFVPVMFELTVFCAAHFMSLTYLVRNKMYPGAKAQNPDPRTTDDKFLIEIHTNDVETIKNLFVETGAEEVTVRSNEPVVEKSINQVEEAN